jgi:hypothetical protein
MAPVNEWQQQRTVNGHKRIAFPILLTELDKRRNVIQQVNRGADLSANQFSSGMSASTANTAKSRISESQVVNVHRNADLASARLDDFNEPQVVSRFVQS